MRKAWKVRVAGWIVGPLDFGGRPMVASISPARSSVRSNGALALRATMALAI
jgi:hypothetical protein